jgi:hypothetical protein
MLWQGILYAHVMLSVSANIVMDLETFQGAGPGNIVPRSNASQGVVVHLLKDNIIRYEMCIHSPIDMQINNIVYSNDAGNVGDVNDLQLPHFPENRSMLMKTFQTAALY